MEKTDTHKKIIITFISLFVIIAVCFLFLKIFKEIEYVDVESTDVTNLYAEIFMDSVDYTLKEKKGTSVEEKIVTDQEDEINRIKEEYVKKDYTPDNPYIAINPYVYNNLAAYIIFDVEDEITWEYSVISKEKSKTPDFTYYNDTPQSGTIVIPVVALYENYNNRVKLTITPKEGEKEQYLVNIKTTVSPSNFTTSGTTVEEIADMGMDLTQEQLDASTKTTADEATLKYTINDDEVLKYFDNGFILTETYDIYDLDNNLRFSSTNELGNGALKISDGKFIIVSEDSIVAYLVDLMGKVYATYTLPECYVEGVSFSFHHDSVFTDDGKYLYMLTAFHDQREDVPYEEKFKTESLITKFDIEGGYPIECFDTYKYFSTSKLNNGSIIDPLHLNSIDYYAERNELILSSKDQSMILGINAKNGDLEWFFKYPEAVEEENKDKLLEQTNPNEFIYTSGNHSAFIMRTQKYMTDRDNLYLSVFNNNHCMESYNTPSFAAPGEQVTCNWKEYSSMLIYNIDMNAKTITFEEEIIPDDTRWSKIRSSVFTDVDGIYQVNYADYTLSDGSGLAYSNLDIVDEEGNLMMEVEYEGLGNVYRSRIITEEEIYSSLEINSEELGI